MATFTATILVGAGHPNDGGIIPLVALYLNEGSQPSWTMQWVSDTHSVTSNMTWGATVDHTLEDALVMIAFAVIKAPAIQSLVVEFAPDLQADGTSHCYGFTNEQRSRLYSACANLSEFPKMIVSVFHDSILIHQLERLPRLTPGDIEVSAPVYSRCFDQWSGSIKETGSLSAMYKR